MLLKFQTLYFFDLKNMKGAVLIPCCELWLIALEPSVMKIVSLLQQLISSYNQRNSGEVSCEIGQNIENVF